MGHIYHLHENRDLTFAELKEVVMAAAEGRLERATEKLDGLSIVFTFNPRLGLRVARSGGDVDRGGMDAAALAAKFAGRGNLTDAFNGAFKVLSDAVEALSPDARKRVFGNARTWYSAEVIYSPNANVINYDNNWIVFHAGPVFKVDRDGNVTKANDAPGVAVLERNVGRMQAALTQRSWRLRGPAMLRLKRLNDGGLVRSIVAKIEDAQAAARVGDDATIGDYLRAVVGDEAVDLGLSPEATRVVVERCLAERGGATLRDVMRAVPNGTYDAAKRFIDAAPALLKQAIRPIEQAVHELAVEVLRGLQSVLVVDPDAEVQRLRQQVTSAIQAIEASGDARAMDVLARQLPKLGNVDNVVAAMEGVVFVYKGNTYKLTGSFAPLNQILGLFRYGRSGKVTTEGRDELTAALRELIDVSPDDLQYPTCLSNLARP